MLRVARSCWIARIASASSFGCLAESTSLRSGSVCWNSYSTARSARYVRRFALSTVARPEGGYISVVARVGTTTASTVLRVSGAPD